MSEMKISNTLVNDTNTGEIAYAGQLKDNTVNYAQYAKITAAIKERFHLDDKFQDKLNNFFLYHYDEFHRFLEDPGLDDSIIDSWKEIQDFLAGLPDDETMWLKNQLTRLDNRITAMDIPDGGAYDVSADHVDGEGNYAVYVDLSAALDAVPSEKQKPGMSIRFIQGNSVDSSDNKYVQYFLTKDEWSVNEADWQKMNLEEEIEDTYGKYIENPEWVLVITDNNDSILYGVKTDGKFYFGDGCPPQVIEYVNNYISEYGYNKITINSLLNEKVDKIAGKSLINAEYASSQGVEENHEWIYVNIDSEEKILFGIKTDGKFYAPGGIEGIEGIDELKEDVDVLNKNAGNNIFGLNKDVEDLVYGASEYYLADSHNKGNFTLLIAGDNHGSRGNLDNIVEYLNGMPNIDAGILLGDIVSSQYSDDSTYYTESIANAQKPFLTVIGNHDVGGNASVTASDIVSKYITPNIQYADLANGEYPDGKAYYYKDFSSYKTRIIVLNQYENTDGSVFIWGYPVYSQSMLNWLIGVLQNTPSDYGVIVALHSCPEQNMVIESGKFSSTSRGATLSNSAIQTSGHPITDIVDAWINGTTINESYDRIPYGSSEAYDHLTVSADFTQRGNGIFICYIGGHFHSSFVSHSPSHTGQKAYNVICSDGNKGMGRTYCDCTRVPNTKSYDGFVIMGVNTTRRTVSLVSIGARLSTDMVIRDVFQFGF